MSVRIEQTAERAHRLVETGEVAAAQAMLREALATVEPDPTHASPSLATAAMLYARVLVTLGEPGTARRWAAYAHTASRRLYGADDERTLQAASVLAGVLHRAGAYSRAAHLYRELISHLAAEDGPRSARVLAAQADLATVLHARGDCAHARDLLVGTWTAYRYRYGEDHPVGIKMLARLGGMERSCGLPEPARERFALAETLCRQHLPPGHRLAAQIDVMSRMPPDRRHVCRDQLGWAGEGDSEGGGDQAEQASAWPVTVAQPAPPAEPPQTTASLAVEPQLVTPPAQRPEAEFLDELPEGESAAHHTATEVAPRPAPPVPAAHGEPGGPDWLARRPRQIRLGVMAAMAVMIVTVVTVATAALIARSGSTSDGRRAAPAVVPATPSNGPQTTPPAAQATPPAAQTTPPVPPTTAPATPPAARAPAPPTGVKLADAGTSLTLTWVYPAGAGGPVVLSAGRPGQTRRTFQTLPAGSSRFTVYGLAQGTNYCFGVGIAYSPAVVKTAPPVCTAR